MVVQVRINAARLKRRFKRTLKILLPVFLVYFVAAYFLLPSIWRHYEHQKKLDGLPMVTATAAGIPADPINLSFVGSAKDILCAMRDAGWYAADPITWRSSLEISRSVVFDQPYPKAPVSNLYYAGRAEDMAFEKTVGASADQRNHIRLWMVLKEGDEKRPVWLAAATFDRSVGFSRYTGAITHHTSSDIDAERQAVETDLQKAGLIDARYQVMGIGPTLLGRNGEGDPYFTDGEVWVLRLVEDCVTRTAPPEILPDPPATVLKDAIWKSVAEFYRSAQR
jgi:LssY C-terminus